MVGILTASVIVQKLVERLRVQFPAIKGTWVSLVAYALGFAVAFGFELRFDLLTTSSEVTEHLFAALAVGAGSGFVADVIGRSDS